jgi:hypothetical protein
MARFPGTDKHRNRAGLQPGDVVRCRRSRSNAELHLADRRGVVAEVRDQHARVVFDPRAQGTWLGNESLLPEPDPLDAELARLARLLQLLRAERLEYDADDDELQVFSGAYDAAALDEARALYGPRLRRCALRAEGVHQFVTRLAIEAAPPAPA